MKYSVQRIQQQDVYTMGAKSEDIGKWAVCNFIEIVAVFNRIKDADEKAAELNRAH